jgi:iron-sulfur cluster repair protein YtfE (RIC family)
MPNQPTEQMSSSEARDQIFSQHVALRRLLAETTEIAERMATSEGDLEALRGRAQALYDMLAKHMEFEEQVLPAALRDVVGWGAVIQQKMEEDHLRQREALARAISAIGPTGLSGAELVENVRSFASTLLVDMESEENGLLQADLGALASDAKGG